MNIRKIVMLAVAVGFSGPALALDTGAVVGGAIGGGAGAAIGSEIGGKNGAIIGGAIGGGIGAAIGASDDKETVIVNEKVVIHEVHTDHPGHGHGKKKGGKNTNINTITEHPRSYFIIYAKSPFCERALFLLRAAGDSGHCVIHIVSCRPSAATR